MDGLVSAENIWAGLRNLKRKDIKLYNMYSCEMPSTLNKGYHTTACNDFVLKNYASLNGILNLAEFRTGILLGYWDRHTDPNGVSTDDSKTLKPTRWGNNGTDDSICKQVLSLIPTYDPVMAARAGVPPTPPSK